MAILRATPKQEAESNPRFLLIFKVFFQFKTFHTLDIANKIARYFTSSCEVSQDMLSKAETLNLTTVVGLPQPSK